MLEKIRAKNIVLFNNFPLPLKVVCFFFLLALPKLLLSQSSFEEQMDQLEQLRNQAAIDSALQISLQIEKSTLDKKQLASLEIFTAKCLADLNRFEEAQELLEQSTKKLQVPEDDLLFADIFNVEGEIAADRDLLDLAEKKHNEALGIRSTYLGGKHEKVADSHNNLGNLYYKKQQYQDAIFNHQQALSIREIILESPHPDLALSFNNLAACYYDIGYYQEAIDYNKKALEQYQNLYGQQHLYVADSYNNLGNCYFELNDLLAAINYHEQALEIRSQEEDREGIALSYNNLGNCFTNLGDYVQANTYFENALRILRDIFKEDNLSIAEVAGNQGNALLEIGDYQSALNRLEASKIILQRKLGGDIPNLIPILLNEGRVYIALENFEAALRTFQQCIRLIKDNFDDKHPLLGTSYNNLGNIYSQQANFKAARTNYQAALSIFQQDPEFNKKEIASCLFNLGNCDFEEANYQKAIRAYENTALLLGDQMEMPDLLSSLEINRAKSLRALNRQEEAYEALSGQLARLKTANLPPSLYELDLLLELAAHYKANNKIENLESALLLYEGAIDLIDEISSKYQNDQSKKRLRVAYYTVFEKGIESAFLLYQKQGDEKYIQSAFQIAERSKGLLIRESLNAANARQYANIPDTLLEQEQQISQSLSEYEKMRFEQYHLLDSINKVNLDFEILRLQEAYSNLIKNIELSFPDYYQLKYDFRPTPLADIQKQLKGSEEALLSYFVGDGSIFAFVVLSNKTHLIALESGDIVRSVIQLWDGIRNFTSAQIAEYYTTYANIYAQNGHQIYQQIVAPIKEELNLPEKLIIIPDGVLCYLPFDLLLQTAPREDRLFRFHSYDYLIKNHQISYNYSATLWHQLQNKESQKAKWYFVAFAPKFKEGITDLAPLFYNEPEVKSLAKLMPRKKVFTGVEASIDQFKSMASQCNVLHLATHGQANAMQSDFSYLAFSPMDTSKVLLYTQNIYNLDLSPVEMVVLSACQTGLGEAQPGEGIISLAHAFSYAGARSIITTLWSIDDQKTSEIMQQFYKELKKGKTKDEALRAAKLQYLDSYNGENAHPYFWASFVPLGNMEALDIQSSQLKYWIFGVLLGLGIAFGRGLYIKYSNKSLN